MARMSNLERLGAALAAQPSPLRSPGRAPGDPATGRSLDALLLTLELPSLPPDMTDLDAAVILAAGGDGMVNVDAVKTAFRARYCVTPEFYCEAELAQWIIDHPWCAGTSAPISPVPTFTSDVERNAWIATHRNCPVPPPVPPPLTNHLCTPGEPGCEPVTPATPATPAIPATPASTTPAPSSNGAGTFVMGAAAMALVWWWTSLDKPRTNPRDADRIANIHRLYRHALATDAEFARMLRKEYGSRAGDMRYRTQKQTAEIRAAGKRYEDAIEAYVKATRQ